MSKALAFLLTGAEGLPIGRRKTLTSAEKLELIRVAAFSAGETLSPSEALALIASLFKEDPKVRIDRSRLAELLALVTPAKPPKGRR